MKTLKIVVLTLILAAAFGLGVLLAPEKGGQEGMQSAGGMIQAEASVWTCPMHPQIRQPDPGQCPICGMDLVQADEGGDGAAGPRQLAMSASDAALLQIETEPVLRRFVTKEIRLVGKVDYDETRVHTISAWVAGRLERLFVDYTGVPVRAGEHLVLLYSPEVYQAQTELLEAKQSLSEQTPRTSESFRGMNRRNYESAQEKLLNWGLTSAQIDAIEERGTAEDTVLITSPISGIVIHKALNQGDYVQTGSRIYQVADLGHLWIRLDAYEQDLPWLHYGQQVAIETEALPGQVFPGFISFLSPDVDPMTRTIDVRVNVDNEDGKLKPGMFVRAVVESRLAEAGRVVDPRLQGKWICPMHPEVIEDEPGDCRVCGMPLEPAVQFGEIAALPAEPPLVVPATAPLVTGKRAVVYVQVPGADRPTYEGREVVLGPRAGEHYIVLAGLEEGERVVTRGAFMIDSALQIRAKPGMMTMAGEGEFSGDRYAVFRTSLQPLLDAYLSAWRALADGEEAAARAALQGLLVALDRVQHAELVLRARRLWEEEHANLHSALHRVEEAGDIDGVRAAFEDVSMSVVRLVEAFSHAGNEVLYRMHCPMASDDRGADWLQDEERIANPYFGSGMPGCGEKVRMYAGAGNDEPRGADRRRQPPPEPPEMPRGDEQEPRPQPEPEQEARGQPEAAALDAGMLQPVYDAYLEGQEALAADDAAKAKTAFGRVADTASELLEKTAAGERTGELLTAVRDAARSGARGELEAVRQEFQSLSGAVLALHEAYGHAGGELWVRAFCPMAFDNQGAAWLQRGERIANPYLGSGMPRCGTVQEKLPGGR